MSSNILHRLHKWPSSSGLLSLAALCAAVPSGLLIATPAFAQSETDTDAGPGRGTLMLAGKKATSSIPAVMLGSDMDVTVSGSIARVRVTQVFRNSSKDWVEATYLYPLPEDAAVDSLKMVVGQRVIIGHIKKREEAREIYETAKEQSKKAGLVEQLRPNMFTNSVANVGPGETVMIVIEYQMPLRQAEGIFSLRMPLVVAPRYIPPHTIAANDDMADAAKIASAPVLDPANEAKINPVSITVHLTPGFVPANIDSAYHKANVDGKGDNRTITLADSTVPADRDFELSWRSASADPTVSIFKEQHNNKSYIMASITPPNQDRKITATSPRELVFVIDNSGSMSGTSMDEAKASLLLALTTLRPQDYFNIIRFDDTMTQLFEGSVRATPEFIQQAKTFTEGLEASGGTEMLPALQAALEGAANSPDPKAVRQVIFLTDGSISNEKEMIAAIGADKGRSHIFLVGIGSAPNNYLMSRMANMGRGTYTNIGSAEEVTIKMAKLIDILSRPSVQDLSVTVAGNSYDLTPRMLPDLYVGEPLLLIGQGDKLAGTITVSGRIGNRTWTQTVNINDAIDSPLVAKVWARRRIDDVEADRALGTIDDTVADATVTELGLTFGLVTNQTSLVAVDETPSRPHGELLSQEDLPINLPHGWSFDRLFGGDAARAAVANAAAAAIAPDNTEKFNLPQTASNFAATIFNGLLMFLIGAIGLLTLRQKRIFSK